MKLYGVILAAFLALLFPHLAFAAAGVDDYVTAFKMPQSYPNSIKFQTANAGGDTTNHTWVSCGTATCFCVGLGSGTNGFGNNVAAAAVIAIISTSRFIGSASGPFINFSDEGTGFYGDCQSTDHGVDQLQN